MSEFGETIRQRSPVEVLVGHISTRGAELEYLSGQFASAMEVIVDMQHINDVLAASERPELVMNRQVPQLFGESPDNLGRINNFIPGMRSFGVRQFVKDVSPLAREGEQKMIGRLPYDVNQKGAIALLSGRGDYHTFLNFAAEHAVDADLAHDALMMTHTPKEAFARMLIICPTLTWHLIDKCLDKVGEPRAKQINEELFVAYALMSRLVDENDKHARRNGEADDWALCH